jgi:hypothetical protein
MTLRFVIRRHKRMDSSNHVGSAGDAGTVKGCTVNVHVAATE